MVTEKMSCVQKCFVCLFLCSIPEKLLRVTRQYVKLVHAGHFPCYVRHHVLPMFEKSDIMSDKVEVSHIKPTHAGHFRFHVRRVPRGLHIWRTLKSLLLLFSGGGVTESMHTVLDPA